MLRRVLLTAGVAALFGVAAGPAAAATRWVNDNGVAVPPGTSCEMPGYNSVEAAVNASGPGDTVNVCPGTYVEQVSVEPGKNGLTLRSTIPLAAVIKAPPTIAADVVNFQSIVRVTGSRNVSIVAFVITGPGPHGCNSLRFGVKVDGDGSANILGNHITMIRDNPFSGCQNGVAVQVGRQAEGTTGDAVIVGNKIDEYQKNGPTIDNVGSSALIKDNWIQGIGQTLVTAQNGIQVSRGANAYVARNWVLDNAYITPIGRTLFTATGILLFQAGSSTVVEDNELRRNQDGVGLYTMTGAKVADNRITGGFAPVAPGVGIFNLGDGIYAGEDTANNRIVGNYLRDNVEHDCHDDSVGPYNPPAFVANPWIDNDGLTENKPGLCKAGGADDDHDDDDDDDDDDRKKRRHSSPSDD